MCDRGHLATHPHRNTREKIFTSSVLRLSVFSKHPWANCLVSSATQDVAAEGATSKHRDGWQNPNGNPARPQPAHRIDRGFFFGGQGAQPCLMWRKAEKARCSSSVSAWPCAARHIIPEQFQPTGAVLWGTGTAACCCCQPYTLRDFGPGTQSCRSSAAWPGAIASLEWNFSALQQGVYSFVSGAWRAEWNFASPLRAAMPLEWVTTAAWLNRVTC